MADTTSKTYEEVAAYSLDTFAEHFGLSRVEGKQSIPGVRSGTAGTIEFGEPHQKPPRRQAGYYETKQRWLDMQRFSKIPRLNTDPLAIVRARWAPECSG